MDTSKKLPFWLRRVDVAVTGKAAAEQRAEFNWRLVSVPLYGLMVVLGSLFALWSICLAFGLTVSLVKAFPAITAIVLLYLFFKRR
jgi:hypothetical protein